MLFADPARRHILINDAFRSAVIALGIATVVFLGVLLVKKSWAAAAEDGLNAVALVFLPLFLMQRVVGDTRTPAEESLERRMTR